MGIVEGKVAIVTGGTRGIGFTIVREFLKNGAKVALAGSRQETVDAALAKLAEEGWPYLPTMELVFTMEPPSPCSIMMRAAA